MGSAGDAGVMCDKHASSCAVEDVFMIVCSITCDILCSFCAIFLKVIFIDLSICACGLCGVWLLLWW